MTRDAVMAALYVLSPSGRGAILSHLGQKFTKQGFEDDVEFQKRVRAELGEAATIINDLVARNAIQVRLVGGLIPGVSTEVYALNGCM